MTQRFRNRGRAVCFVLLFGLVATACGSATTAETAASPDASAETAEATGGPSLTGEFGTISGETVDLSTYQGQDVVLWFWAPW